MSDDDERLVSILDEQHRLSISPDYVEQNDDVAFLLRRLQAATDRGVKDWEEEHTLRQEAERRAEMFEVQHKVSSASSKHWAAQVDAARAESKSLRNSLRALDDMFKGVGALLAQDYGPEIAEPFAKLRKRVAEIAGTPFVFDPKATDVTVIPAGTQDAPSQYPHMTAEQEVDWRKARSKT